MAALCLLCCVACTPQKDTPKKLKVLSWNVWHGGHSKTYPGKGCEGTVGILKKSGADVVLMVETYGAAPMVADSLGYQYHLISDNLCIYSRYPIVEKYAFPDSIGTFNFGGVKIDMDGTPVRISTLGCIICPICAWFPRTRRKKKFWLGKLPERGMTRYGRFFPY